MAKKQTPSIPSITFLYPDLHIPFEDKRAVALAHKVCAVIQPERIVQMGDLVDCYKESHFEKDPDYSLSVEKESDLAYWFWEECSTLSPGCELVWIEGNHEVRWERLRRAKGMSRRAVRTIPELMQFGREELGVKWIQKERQPCKVGRFLLQHGKIVRKYSAYTAKAMLDDKWTDIAIAHTHRAGSHYKTLEGARLVQAHETGCLCEYKAEYIDGHPNWQHAIAMIYHYKTHDEFKVYPFSIAKKRYYVTVNGELMSV